MNAVESVRALRLLETDDDDVRFRDALIELFDGDGTVYLVSGYFTYQGYLAIRDSIEQFLERSRENQLVAIVSPASDQFSSRIALDLWNLDEHDQVTILKKSRGLHAKLYLRDGPRPKCIVGSANITQVAFKYNIELNVEFERDRVDHPDMQPFLDWVEELKETSDPLRRRDLFGPVQFGGSVINWSNKARLLPARNVALRVAPVILLIIILSSVFRVI